MSHRDRGRRLEHQEEALALQTRGAILGAIRWTGYGLAAATIAQFTWPLFRRQTLAFKGFLVSGATIFGLVIGAETYLQSYESSQRAGENRIRRQARNELALKGIIATETEIRKWRAQQEAAQAADASGNSAAPEKAPP